MEQTLEARTQGKVIGSLITPTENQLMSLPEWERYFYGKYASRKMISAPDLYRIAKQASRETITDIKADLAEGKLLADTKLYFFSNGLADILHNPTTHLVRPTSYKEAIVPVYDYTPIWRAVRRSVGSEFLQKLFDTEDSGVQIANSLSNMVSYVNNICLVTPNEKQRENLFEGSTAFYYDIDKECFVVDCRGAAKGLTKAISVMPGARA